MKFLALVFSLLLLLNVTTGQESDQPRGSKLANKPEYDCNNHFDLKGPVVLCEADDFTNRNGCLDNSQSIGDASKAFEHTIQDFVEGYHVPSSVLSERLTAQYMYDHMGSFDGPEPDDLERLQNVEAYNIVIRPEEVEFVVDRRSILESQQPNMDQNEAADAALVQAALQGWFRKKCLYEGHTH